MPSPSTAQNVPKVASSRPTTYFSMFSGTAASGRCATSPIARTTTPATAAPTAASGTLSAFRPNVITMNTTSSALEEHPLERDDEREPVEPESSVLARPGGGLALLAKRLRLVVHRLEPGRAEDRLAQPLQPEDEEQRADRELQRRLGDQSISA